MSVDGHAIFGGRSPEDLSEGELFAIAGALVYDGQVIQRYADARRRESHGEAQMALTTIKEHFA